MARTVFPGAVFDRPLLADYLKTRTADACERMATLTREAIERTRSSDAAAERLAHEFDVEPVELGEPVGLPVVRSSKRTGDPRRAQPGNRDPAVLHDRYRIRRRIVKGDQELLRQWPNRGGMRSVELTTYDDSFVYVTWDEPAGDDLSRWTAIAKEHMDLLDAALAMSRCEVEAWRPGLYAAARAAVRDRVGTLAAADQAYSSLGAAPAARDPDADGAAPTTAS
jgi:hypothetical protein